MRELLFCISGPSGVGKGTLVKELIRTDPSLALSVSCTTRPPRAGERDGVEYFFLTREQFLKKRDEGGFLEYDEHFGNFYGTPKDYVFDMMEQGRSVLLEIDVVGALTVKKVESDVPVVTIMIVAPSEEALAARLSERGSEDDDQLHMRQERVGFELSKIREYDYVIVNDKLEDALSRLREIIQKEKNK